MLRVCFLVLVLASQLGFAATELVLPTEVQASVNKRILGVGLGAGLPSLLGGELFIYAAPRLQVGAGYGIAPNIGPFSPRLKGEQLSGTTSTGAQVSLVPSIQARWVSISPYVRYFPMERNFYLQFTMSLFTTHVKIASDLYDPAGNRIEGASLSGEGRAIQYLPTISIGHLFTTDIFFCNFALGGTFVLSSFETHMSLSGELPDSLGGTASNESLVKGIQSRVNRVLKKGIGMFRSEVPFVPSFSLTVGIFI